MKSHFGENLLGTLKQKEHGTVDDAFECCGLNRCHLAEQKSVHCFQLSKRVSRRATDFVTKTIIMASNTFSRRHSLVLSFLNVDMWHLEPLAHCSKVVHQGLLWRWDQVTLVVLKNDGNIILSSVRNA